RRGSGGGRRRDPRPDERLAFAPDGAGLRAELSTNAVLTGGSATARAGADAAVCVVVAEVLADAAALRLTGRAHRAAAEAGIGEPEIEGHGVEEEAAGQSGCNRVIAAAAQRVGLAAVAGHAVRVVGPFREIARRIEDAIGRHAARQRAGRELGVRIREV